MLVEPSDKLDNLMWSGPYKRIEFLKELYTSAMCVCVCVARYINDRNNNALYTCSINTPGLLTMLILRYKECLVNRAIINPVIGLLS